MGGSQVSSWSCQKVYVFLQLLALNSILTRRPVMRLGKPIECLQAALKASFSPGPVAEIITMVARQVGYFSYLNYDALIWVCNPQLRGTYTTLNSHQM